MTLVERGYYNDTVFHRLIPGFMIQGGDPTGTGTGGESAFGQPFRDEFDSRLLHDKRGVLSMANAGANTNKSQFFITFQAARHLDLIHCVFGRVVGGNATLDRMESIGSDKKEAPLSEIKILGVLIIQSPISEADDLLRADIIQSKSKTDESAIKTIMSAAGSKLNISDIPVGKNRPITEGPLNASVIAGAAIPSRDHTRTPITTVSSVSGMKRSSVDTLSAPAALPAPAPLSHSSQADKIAAFLRSQGDAVDGAVPKKQKSNNGGGFSNW